MNASRLTACLLTLGLLGLGPSMAEARTVNGGLLAGKVTDSSTPLATAKVYAYQLADLTLRKAATDGEGNFFFQQLPAGLYKVIAYKSGFLPAVVMLARSSADADQFLDLQLLRESLTTRQGTDFWQLRDQIPQDVLREIGFETGPAPSGPAPSADLSAELNQHLQDATFKAEMQALAGVDGRASSRPEELTGGRLGLDGRVGATEFDLQASYLQRATTANTVATDPDRQSAVSLQIQSPGDSTIQLDSRTSHMSTRESAGGDPVDFEHYRLSWAAPVGERGRTEVSAQYTTQNNFYRQSGVDPMEIPDASRTLRLRGSYTRAIGDQGNFETELRYREQESRYLADSQAPNLLGATSAYETLELLSRAGWRVQPTVLVEYGLYTKLRDGSLTLTPRGSLVWQLTPEWQATTAVSHRVHDDTDTAAMRDFLPAFYNEAGNCEMAEEYCYELLFTHRKSEDEKLTFGAVHREYGETLRLFFDEDFFNHLESLYLVRGDRLPEFQFAVSRRISPRVLATLESNLATGGGGMVYGVDSNLPYENRVRYMVTSLDTLFQSTSTGVFLAFHHLQQQLESTRGETNDQPELEFERLQLMLTQDLNILADLAADWALQLNMELSRGGTLSEGNTADDELRKRFLGGLAVRF